MSETKFCRSCETEKPVSEFHQHIKKYTHHHNVNPVLWGKQYGNGYQTDCRVCRGRIRREANKDPRIKRQVKNGILKSTFGITIEQYDAMVSGQGGVCKICKEAPGKESKWVLHVDHCHTTGRIRGLLCAKCNTGLGNFKDKPEVLEQARAYLVSGF